MSAPAPAAAPRVHPVLVLLLAMLSIQGGAALAKGLFAEVGPFGAAGLRVTLAALLLLAVFRPRLGDLRPQDWRAIVPYGAALGLMNVTFYAALARLPLGIAVTLEFLGPLLLSLFLSRRPADLLWVVLAASGIFMMAPRDVGSAALDPLGMALALLAGAFWALYIVVGGKVSQRVRGTTGVAAGMVIAALVSLPGMLYSAGAAVLQPGVLLTGLAVAVFSSALPYNLEMVALKHIPAKVFGVLSSLEPAIAALAGLLLLGETLTPVQWLALLFVMLASVGMTLSNRASAHG